MHDLCFCRGPLPYLASLQRARASNDGGPSGEVWTTFVLSEELLLMLVPAVTRKLVERGRARGRGQAEDLAQRVGPRDETTIRPRRRGRGRSARSLARSVTKQFAMSTPHSLGTTGATPDDPTQIEGLPIT